MKPLTVNHRPTMFGVRRFTASGDLICLVTSQEQVSERSYDVIDQISLLYVTTLQGLLTIGIMIVEICLILHVLSQDHVIKG